MFRLLTTSIVKYRCYSIAAVQKGFERVVFSGIQPTGAMHIGNYFGAIEQWLKLQTDHMTKVYISVVDLHAITEYKDPSFLKTSVRDMVASLLACGIDPKHCVIFQQSRVMEHTMLACILSNCVNVSQLQRTGQYKDKCAKYKDGSQPLGLLTYPVLQAADILLYKTTHVPVGEDQEQHLYIAQSIVEKFFHLYKQQYFPRPEILKVKYPRVKSLRNVEKKMSKSDPDAKTRIEIGDSREVMKEKVKKALSDSISHIYYEPTSRPAVSNLMVLHSLISGKTFEQINSDVANLNTAQFKQLLGEMVAQKFGPISDEYCRLKQDVGYLENVLAQGCDQARAVASKHMEEIRKIVGLD